jgi:hypothetical protein
MDPAILNMPIVCLAQFIFNPARLTIFKPHGWSPLNTKEKRDRKIVLLPPFFFPHALLTLLICFTLLMTLTMNPSSLELLILHEMVLFKERSIDLVVGAGKVILCTKHIAQLTGPLLLQAYCSFNNNSGLFLLEIFDGASSMFGFLLGGSHPFCSQHSR